MHVRAARTFLFVVMITAVAVMTVVQLTDHLALHGIINGVHAPWADLLLKNGTHLADGWIPVVLGIILLFVRWRWFLMMGVSTLGSSIIIQTLKHTLFSGVDRPSMFAEAMGGIRLVPGVEMLHHNSFPSGHSTCAFSMCMALAVIIGNRNAAVVLAVLAAILAFTRVYLSQHFTEDVLCGACIGTITAWCVYRWLYTSGFSGKRWLDRSLLRRQNQ